MKINSYKNSILEICGSNNIMKIKIYRKESCQFRHKCHEIVRQKKGQQKRFHRSQPWQ